MTLDDFYEQLKVYRLAWNTSFLNKIKTALKERMARAVHFTYLYWKKTGKWVSVIHHADASSRLGLSAADAKSIYEAIDNIYSKVNHEVRQKLISICCPPEGVQVNDS